MEIDGNKVGLTRFINSTGCVSYIINDLKGKRIEAKFFDPLGNIVKSCSQEDVPIVLGTGLKMRPLHLFEAVELKIEGKTVKRAKSIVLGKAVITI